MIKNYLNDKNIFINVDAKSKNEVFQEVFNSLKNQGCVDDKYLDSMIQRDQHASVAIGNYIAIAHGTVETKDLIKNNGMCFLVLKNPIQWDGNEVKVVLGLAFIGDEAMDVIGNIGVAFSDEDEVKDFYYQNDLTTQKVLDWLISHDE
ncbi:PTS sugar transporter subunit IIA [Mycoplasma sp. E35C]|uniref:PTS sugar transporter subunit IIA n=1 Tax=Mycoplasma sp. E35C TaxID=2801918 RepID=UPI001CA3E894|nr:PTS sugar transporter subunit IIA [Mycoplasma sp. E35C]QZX49093.1 PTS sugar transporter subunit IIA [Mycoplasma sp. E35C]